MSILSTSLLHCSGSVPVSISVVEARAVSTELIDDDVTTRDDETSLVNEATECWDTTEIGRVSVSESVSK